MKTLRARLLLTMLALLGVTMTGVLLATRGVTHNEIRKLEIATEARRGAGTVPRVDAIVRALAKARDWNDARRMLDTLAAARRAVIVAEPEAAILWKGAELADAEIAITPRGLQIDRGPLAARVRLLFAIPETAIHDAARRPLGSLYVIPPAEPVPLAPSVRVDRSLLAIFAAAALLAATSIWFLTRRLTRPVEELTAAVRRMERGERAVQVAPRTDDEIGALAQAFNAMSASIARGEELRKRMMGDVAHELRTPLTNILCQLESVQDGVRTLDRELIDSLHHDAAQLGTLVGDLQELAVAEAGGVRLDAGPQRLVPLVDRVLAGAGGTASARRIALRNECPDLIVRADEVRLLQIVRNLVDNALAHTPPHGEVVIGAARRDGEVVISVRDNGEGIAAEDLDRVFERFYRADASRSRKTGGAGLGLAIVRQLVAMHGGRVWCESEGRGRGAAFFFTLPLA
ncbi:MAG TPA: ATP-binding protein [Thermoanaerobaculia bacterium]|nr:ATP-binding protein [Thermoanaerobaculia bacterium]